MSCVLAFFSYINIDPLKSSLYLLFSIIFISFFFRCLILGWFFFFLLFIFLSGLFVILVYVSRIVKFRYQKSYGGLFCLLFFFFSIEIFQRFFGVYKFFFWFFFCFFLWFFFIFFFFLILVIYSLNNFGTLRKF